jgi:hypothetical protein
MEYKKFHWKMYSFSFTGKQAVPIFLAQFSIQEVFVYWDFVMLRNRVNYYNPEK